MRRAADASHLPCRYPWPRCRCPAALTAGTQQLFPAGCCAARRWQAQRAVVARDSLAGSQGALARPQLAQRIRIAARVHQRLVTISLFGAHVVRRTCDFLTLAPCAGCRDVEADDLRQCATVNFAHHQVARLRAEVTRGFAERPREAIVATAFSPGGEAQHITVSIGIASLAKDRDTRPSLMVAANAALYRAKKEGRNRVCIETWCQPLEFSLFAKACGRAQIPTDTCPPST